MSNHDLLSIQSYVKQGIGYIHLSGRLVAESPADMTLPGLPERSLVRASTVRSASVRPLLLALIVAGTVIGMAACADGGHVVTGIVIDIRQSGPASVEGFTLRADDGRLLTFDVAEIGAGDGGFPAVHLRDHLASAQEVAVRFVETNEGLRAIRLADAP